MHAMQCLETGEEQFELFCYAALWSAQHDHEGRVREKSFEEFLRLNKKFGLIWNGNAHHTLPIIDLGISDSCLSKDGIDFEALLNGFKKLADRYEFILW